ncbi:hypothetical protein C8R44DRAFT_724702 [Mycena epipterygia]|nr:hypothetical protein C8R44DRAFT_724702 [Mycena epipterygia]
MRLLISPSFVFLALFSGMQLASVLSLSKPGARDVRGSTATLAAVHSTSPIPSTSPTPSTNPTAVGSMSTRHPTGGQWHGAGSTSQNPALGTNHRIYAASLYYLTPNLMCHDVQRRGTVFNEKKEELTAR